VGNEARGLRSGRAVERRGARPGVRRRPTSSPRAPWTPWLAW